MEEVGWVLWAEWGGVGEGSGVRRGPWRAVSTVGPLSDVRALSMGDGHQGQGQLQEAVGSWDLTQVRGDHRTWGWVTAREGVGSGWVLVAFRGGTTGSADERLREKEGPRIT